MHRLGEPLLSSSCVFFLMRSSYNFESYSYHLLPPPGWRWLAQPRRRHALGCEDAVSELRRRIGDRMVCGSTRYIALSSVVKKDHRPLPSGSLV